VHRSDVNYRELSRQPTASTGIRRAETLFPDHFPGEISNDDLKRTLVPPEKKTNVKIRQYNRLPWTSVLLCILKASYLFYY